MHIRIIKQNKDIDYLLNSSKNPGIFDFENIYKIFFGPICYFIKQILLDPEITKDIAQDTFILLYMAMQNKPNKYSVRQVRTFLYLTARNNAFNYLKHIKICKEYDAVILHLQKEEDDMEFEKSVFKNEVYRLISEKLTVNERKAVGVYLEVRGRLKDETYAHFAPGKNPQTMRNARTRAFKRLCSVPELKNLLLCS